ncbi:MAG: LysR family transcriptional regulator [Alphaproteobacteria bacterium]|nr:LysR family transcriptional regulator [Alphaproteobacteria bacterium]MCD8520640.1 LysR family transcriptional regulator [Alphaproteobacteria bacterium]MCD8563175.1 LysR family transcriptional regulator [Alphaproteobacteria bacterium]
MDWDKLRIFYAVAEAGSFTHAGETLNLSQSAVSRQISSLEESLGTTLFHRHARGLILTEQGELLYKTTKDVFAQLSQVEGQLVDSHKSGQGPLVVTVSEFIGSTWLVPKLHELREKHPEIQLTILFDDKLFNLGMREADVAIRLMKPEQPDLIQRHLSRIQFHICASQGYIDKYGAPQKIEELGDHMMVGFPENAPPPFVNPNWILSLAKIPPSHPRLMVLNSMYAILKAVETGAGIAPLPDYLIHGNANIKIVLPDLKRPDVDLYFVYPEERRNSRRIAILRDFLLENIEKTPFVGKF